ncbi:MAG: PAS domain S-box protein [Desulfuromonadales bacterium]|nr:PAS domain S-box protein [Desulfuromonadales bacterium]
MILFSLQIVYTDGMFPLIGRDLLSLWRRVPSAVLAALLLALSAGPADAQQERDILILHSYHLGQVWTDSVMAGMQEVLGADPAGLRLHVEYMDTKRFNDSTYLLEVLEVLLTHKLQRLDFDLVLLSDNDALDFVLRHRDNLFPGTPIIFSGINNFRPEMIAGFREITGVAETPNFRETLNLALEFHPQVRKIVVLRNRRNETDRQNHTLLMEVVPEFADRVEFEFWADLPMEALEPRLGQLGPEALVFINGLTIDATGRTIPFPESTPRLRAATSVPLYSAWDFFLGHGIVGGRLVCGLRHGELAAQLALRVLAGENPDALPVIIEGTNQYMFDFRELQRFGISRSRLPAGSVVINRPLPFVTLNQREAVNLLAGGFALLILLSALVVNILHRRRSEKALRASEERFRAIADYTCDWEGWLDAAGKLCWVNPSVQRFTGFSVEECMAMPDYPLPIIHEEDREEMAQVVASTLKVRTTGNNFPFRIRRKDGEVRWMAVSWQPIYHKDGRFLGVRAGVRDITEQQQAVEDLQATNQELDAFVRTVSHDLRTPLTPIIGYAEYLRQQYGDTLDETARFALEQIEQTGHRMHAMLEDLLSLARVGSLEPPEEPVNSEAVVREILANLGPVIAQAEAEVTVGTLPKIRVPGVFVAQALENLIGNALRYAGGAGLIEVGGEAAGEMVRFYVRDHGPGIPDEEKKRVFDLFYRGDAALQNPGTGVGLATVRRIARRCGGRVWVEDTPGGGSTFWLELAAVCPIREGK